MLHINLLVYKYVIFCWEKKNMAPSIWQLLIVAVIILLLFGGKGKISSIMGDFGKGLKSFKDQIKAKKETDEDNIEVISEDQISPKMKTAKKTTKKKQTTKKKT